MESSKLLKDNMKKTCLSLLFLSTFFLNMSIGYANTQTPAANISTNCSAWSNNLNCTMTNQQLVDNAVDQLVTTGGTNPGGSNGQFQYNNSGIFAGGNMWTTGGNIGIGTSTPISAFEVNGESIFNGPVADVRSLKVLANGGDDGANIINALNFCASNKYTCYFPAKTYNSSIQIQIPNNSYIYVQAGAIFNETNQSLGESFWAANATSNIYIYGYGSTWQWNPRPPSGGQQGHDFGVRGASNVWIWGAIANNSGGDGFLIGEDGAASSFFSSNVHIVDCSANNDLRNAMSITSVKGLYVENFIGSNSNGSAPQMGIDIEPNGNEDFLENIHIDNLHTFGNVSAGLNFSINNLVGTANKNVTIDVKSPVDYQSASGITFQGVNIGTYEMNGKITIDNPISIEPKDQGFSARNYDINAPRITVMNPTVIRPNTSNSADPTLGSAIVVTRLSTDSGATNVGNVLLVNPRVVDDRGSPLTLNGFYINDQLGSGMQNVDVTGEVSSLGTFPLFSTPNQSTMLITNNGNVGINKVPAQALDVQGTVQSLVLSAVGTGNSLLNLTGGNVGIGTPNPGEPLDVNGTIRSTSGGIQFPDNTIQTTASTSSLWVTQNTTDESLAGGNVGIGTILTTGAALTIMNGNVGIGTWLPAYGFEIDGAGGTVNKAALRIHSTSSNSAREYFQVGVNPYSTIRSGIVDASDLCFDANQSNNCMFEIHQLGNIGIGSTTVQGINSVLVTGNGNMGIGSSQPGQQLDVQGTIRALFFSGNGSGLTNVATSAGGSPSQVQYNIGGNLAGSSSFIFNGSNVGIGSANPGQILDVQGTIRSTNFIDTSVSPSSVLIVNSTNQVTSASNLQDLPYCQSNGTNCPAGGTNPWKEVFAAGNVGIATTSSVGIGTTSGSAMLTVMNGNVGIGTWNPQGLFEMGAGLFRVNSAGQVIRVNGNAVTWDNTQISNTNNGTDFFTNSSNGSSATLDFKINTTEFLKISNGGNLGIGSLSPGQLLDVQGTIRISKLGSTLSIIQGSNACAGQAALSGGTVTVSTNCAPTTSKGIILTDAGGGVLANIGSLSIGTVTSGTSFIINSSNALDSSNCNWEIHGTS